jgi:hypothetical protein
VSTKPLTEPIEFESHYEQLKEKRRLARGDTGSPKRAHGYMSPKHDKTNKIHSRVR